MWAASTPGGWKRGTAFFSLSNILLQTKRPKTELYSRPCLSRNNLGRNHSSVWTLPLQAEHTVLISTFCNSSIPPWEILGKIFITITQYKLTNRERTENYLVG